VLRVRYLGDAEQVEVHPIDREMEKNHDFNKRTRNSLGGLAGWMLSSRCGRASDENRDGSV
jgi:hypothetical protein